MNTIKELTKYRTTDGTEFYTLLEAELHEEYSTLIRQCRDKAKSLESEATMYELVLAGKMLELCKVDDSGEILKAFQNIWPATNSGS